MQSLICQPSILMVRMPTQHEIGFHAEFEHTLMSVVLRAARGGREEPGDPEQHDRRARPQAGGRQGALPTAAVPYLQGGCWSRREAPLPSVLTPPARALFAAHYQCPCGLLLYVATLACLPCLKQPSADHRQARALLQSSS